VTSLGRLFQTLAPATGKARLPTVGRYLLTYLPSIPSGGARTSPVYRFEKMISGMYLGEIVRLVIMQCADARLLFDGQTVSDELQTPGRFYTKYISEIEGCVLAN